MADKGRPDNSRVQEAMSRGAGTAGHPPCEPEGPRFDSNKRVNMVLNVHINHKAY